MTHIVLQPRPRVQAAWVAWGAVLLAAALTACSHQPRTPDWQMNAHASAQKAIDAYLSGHTRVELLEWDRARAEVARTGHVDLLARLELMRCAVQVASLVVEPCSRFDALLPDVSPASQAYADYLAQRVKPQQIPLLPVAQRRVASTIGGASGLATASSALVDMEDPLSRLVAAGVLFRAGQASPQVITTAIDTASAQGWRRPLLAWLGIQLQRAQASGDAVAAAAVRRRVDMVQGQGQGQGQGTALP